MNEDANDKSAFRLDPSVIKASKIFDGDRPAAPFIKAAVEARGHAAASDAPYLSFESILDVEDRFIRFRRRHLRPATARPEAAGGPAPETQAEAEAGPDKERLTDLCGLALSGGGIRSSTFCLGVVQALALKGVLKRLDYLSTVSGGGYFGSSLVATTIESPTGAFAFGNEDQPKQSPQDEPHPSADDVADTLSVGHLRNYSNYLVPNGAWDFFTSAAVFLRGLAANAALVLWVPLLAAGLTVWCNPSRSALGKPKLLMLEIPWFSPQHFLLTQVAFVLLGLVYLTWAVRRSLRQRDDTFADSTGGGPSTHAIFSILAAAVAFWELQPFVIEQLFAAKPAASGASPWFGTLAGLGVVIAPFATLVTAFRGPLTQFLENGAANNRLHMVIGRMAAKAMLWAAALALPLLIWLFYICLCYWAIGADGLARPWCHAPAWIEELAKTSRWLPPLCYGLLAAGLLAVSSWLTPNANSLHHLYRDRLARAFHFKPPAAGQYNVEAAPSALMMHELASAKVPYLLINTAINLESSREANRRGRNADFFIISPLFVGSRVTGYLPSASLNKGKGLTLATAVAVSGAAASSTMGSSTIRQLSPTLAMLNVRLGYWLANPAAVALGTRRSRDDTRLGKRIRRQAARLRNSPHFYLFAEMFGLMTEVDDRVYLTDGGHVENLGIYELLRRRCKVIIAVDAEADPNMRFASLVTLQIFARLDLGIRIDLPVDDLRETTLASMAKIDDSDEPGPHVAIGVIDYGDQAWGTLIYIKASLTGDENDYIHDYAKRNPKFPHESTSDQFFSEEQFEVYRALGFHAASRFVDSKDQAVVTSDDGPVLGRLKDAKAPIPSRKSQRPDVNDLLFASQALLSPP